MRSGAEQYRSGSGAPVWAQATTPAVQQWAQVIADQPDHIAAAYLDELERARLTELQSIRSVRARLETVSVHHGAGSASSTFLWRNRRYVNIASAFTFLLALAIMTAALVLGDARSVSAPAASAAAIAGNAGSMPAMAGMNHDAGMGSGIAVELGEYFLRPSKTTAKAGHTTFVVRNSGAMAHEFMIIPLARVRGQLASLDSQQMHAIAIAARHGIAPGTRNEVAVDLRPGKYILFCGIPGHLTRGQSSQLTVA